jgi:small-conductance mechanosensitive channel
MFVEDTNRKHYTVEEYKNITNYDNTKKILNEIKLELPDTPDITDIKVNRLSKKRDERILEEIIKPKDDLIKKLYKDNLLLHRELSKQSNVVDEAEKYQKERDSLIANNQELHNTVRNLEYEYAEKKKTLDNEFKDKSSDLEYEYKHKINKLEKENKHLKKVIDKFKETTKKFIKWICKKFDLPSEDEIIRDFEKETHTFIDVEKQIKKEDREKEYELDR